MVRSAAAPYGWRRRVSAVRFASDNLSPILPAMWVLPLIVSFGLALLLLAGFIGSGIYTAYGTARYTGRPTPRSTKVAGLSVAGVGLLLMALVLWYLGQAIDAGRSADHTPIPVEQAVPTGEPPPTPTNVPYR